MSRATPPSLRTTKTPAYRRLADAARVRMDASSCLSVRIPGEECGLCAAACPVDALALVDGTPELRGNCLGCGLCSAACPTSALQTDGFTAPPDIPAGTSAIQVDCWRVPIAETGRGAIRVPCLGGIATGWLLDVFDRGGERPIKLLDHGGCSTCPAGAGLAAARAAVAEVRTLLGECGVPPVSLPRVVSRPAHFSLAPAIPSAADARALGRRGFFRDLAGEAARTLGDTDAAPAAPMLRHMVAPVERMRLVTALARIAARHGREVPSRALPQATLGACAAHGVCAGVCPTGALQRSGDGGELRFLPALCIGCGGCTRACPERSIRVAPSGGRITAEVLARWAERECEACGRSFVGSSGGLCPRCTKEADVMRGMAALFQPSL